MTFDFKSVPISLNTPVQFYTALCGKCGHPHLFFLNFQGNPVTLMSFKEAEEKFCQEFEVTEDAIKENGILICQCGNPVRFFEVGEEGKENLIQIAEGMDKAQRVINASKARDLIKRAKGIHK